MEEWKRVRNFPDYSISTLGDVRRDANGRILAYKVNQFGVVYVGLTRAHKQFQRSVALLVAKTFLPHATPAMDTAINLDGNRHNNRVDNLVWRPRWFAIKYNRQFKESYENSITAPIRDLESGAIFDNSFACAIAYGLLERDVVLSIMNRTYVWPTYQQFGLAGE